MLNEAIKLVKSFQTQAQQTVRETPTLLSAIETERRARWIREELNELQEAQTIEEQADAVTDALYYLLGFYVEMGILTPDKLFTTIHESNMAKLNSQVISYAPDGRVLKPDEWKHPEIKI